MITTKIRIKKLKNGKCLCLDGKYPEKIFNFEDIKKILDAKKNLFGEVEYVD